MTLKMTRHRRKSADRRSLRILQPDHPKPHTCACYYQQDRYGEGNLGSRTSLGKLERVLAM